MLSILILGLKYTMMLLSEQDSKWTFLVRSTFFISLGQIYSRRGDIDPLSFWQSWLFWGEWMAKRSPHSDTSVSLAIWQNVENLIASWHSVLCKSTLQYPFLSVVERKLLNEQFDRFWRLHGNCCRRMLAHNLNSHVVLFEYETWNPFALEGFWKLCKWNVPFKD